jgi:hypothetical protein
MSIEVDCSECGRKIADYTGPLGLSTPIQSQFFVRLNGTSPEYGTSTAHACPHCDIIINELQCTLTAVAQALNPPIPATPIEADDESSSDCCS